MKKLRIVLLSTALLILICPILIRLHASHKEQKELNKLSHYELYSSYVKIREEYRVFLMVNPNRDSGSVMDQIFTDAFIAQTISDMKATGFGDYPIKVYLVQPSDELPYGWKKSELNISTNFDRSIFHRNTYCTVTIPFVAKSLQDCFLEYR